MKLNLMQEALAASLRDGDPVEMYLERSDAYTFEVARVIQIWDDGPLSVVVARGTKFEGLLYFNWDELCSVESGTVYATSLKPECLEAVSQFEALKLPTFRGKKEFIAHLISHKVPVEIKLREFPRKHGFIIDIDDECISMSEVDTVAMKFDGVSVICLDMVRQIVAYDPDTVRCVKLAGLQ